MDGRRPFVPEMITVEKDMIGGVGLAAVRTGGVVISSCAKAGGVVGLEGMSSDKLEHGGLVQVRVHGKNSTDELGDGETGWFPKWGKVAT